jgi:hypothetical protein
MNPRQRELYRLFKAAENRSGGGHAEHVGYGLDQPGVRAHPEDIDLVKMRDMAEFAHAQARKRKEVAIKQRAGSANMDLHFTRPLRYAAERLREVELALETKAKERAKKPR